MSKVEFISIIPVKESYLQNIGRLVTLISSGVLPSGSSGRDNVDAKIVPTLIFPINPLSYEINYGGSFIISIVNVYGGLILPYEF